TPALCRPPLAVSVAASLVVVAASLVVVAASMVWAAPLVLAVERRPKAAAKPMKRCAFWKLLAVVVVVAASLVVVAASLVVVAASLVWAPPLVLAVERHPKVVLAAAKPMKRCAFWKLLAVVVLVVVAMLLVVVVVAMLLVVVVVAMLLVVSMAAVVSVVAAAPLL
ncbi:unnamed protein product, partial [Aphanomyces euteiches]